MLKKNNLGKIKSKLFLSFIFLILFVAILRFVNSNKTQTLVGNLNIPILSNQDLEMNFLFVGDIFLDRHIDELSQKSKLKFAYPFSKLDTLEKNKYNAWIGNLECPVTEEQSTKYEKEEYLKFSCKKEYLPELKKYFDIVSLANNHTNNMNGRKGIEETRKHLDDAGIKYFGDFDNSQIENICKIIFIEIKNETKIPIAFCGFHGVYKLPTDEEIKIVNKYSKYFITFVMPHQGEEYKPVANSFQEKIYHKFIDNGADAVFGAHPHVIQNVEKYKGKIIFYSLGNFIFDQSWIKTREHMTVRSQIIFPEYKNNYINLHCENISSVECLKNAEQENIIKPEFSLDFNPIFTEASTDFLTHKAEYSPEKIKTKLYIIGFTKIDKTLKR